MTPENARILSMAFANFGSRDDATVLAAARAAARLIAAAGVSPGSLAAMVAANVAKAEALRARPFSDLGPKGTRKRLAELSRRRGVSDEDRASIMALRARWEEAERPDMTPRELEWLDQLWTAPIPPKAARASKPG